MEKCALGTQNMTDITNIKDHLDNFKQDVSNDLAEVKEDIRVIRDDLIFRPTQAMSDKVARAYAFLGGAIGVIVSMIAIILTLMNASQHEKHTNAKLEKPTAVKYSIYDSNKGYFSSSNSTKAANKPYGVSIYSPIP